LARQRTEVVSDPTESTSAESGKITA
jgi:hypothetical protein